MPITVLDPEAIVAQNPNTSIEALRRAETLVERMTRLGIQPSAYQIASPFSSSLRKTHMSRSEDASRHWE